jgi:hypothetical protein
VVSNLGLWRVRNTAWTHLPLELGVAHRPENLKKVLVFYFGNHLYESEQTIKSDLAIRLNTEFFLDFLVKEKSFVRLYTGYSHLANPDSVYCSTSYAEPCDANFMASEILSEDGMYLGFLYALMF